MESPIDFGHTTLCFEEFPTFFNLQMKQDFVVNLFHVVCTFVCTFVVCNFVSCCVNLFHVMSLWFKMFGRDPIVLGMETMFEPKQRYLGDENTFINLEQLHKFHMEVAMHLHAAHKKADQKYSAIPNFFLMRTFNMTQLTSKEIDALSNNLPTIDKIPIHNVTRMLKNINSNYPFVFPVYGYVLIASGGTALFIVIIGVLYYTRFKIARAKVLRQQKSKHMNTNEIKLQPMSVKATRKQAQDLMEKDTVQPTRVTPLLLKTRLEEDLGIDFSSYDKFKKKQCQSRKHSNNMIIW